MENLIFSVNIVFPLFLLMAAGIILKKSKLITDGFLEGADKLVFRFFLPSILFYSMYSADLRSLLNIKLIIFTVCAMVAMNAAAFGIVILMKNNNGRRGALLQAMTRSNFLLFGIPICQAVYGTVGTAAVSVVAAVFIPISNFFAVLALSCFNDEGRASVKGLLHDLATNPFIISTILAVIINLLKIHFPYIVVKALQDTAGMATPFALIVLGAEIELKSLKSNLRAIVGGTAMKLVIFPGLILTAAYFYGFRGLEFCILLSAFCAPVAVSSYVMAKSMHCDYELAGQLVVSTSLMSVVTIFVFVFLSKSFGIL